MDGVRAIREKLSSIPYRKKARVFDIACGTGMLGLTFSDIVYGVDINVQAVRVAKKHGVRAYIGDVEKPWKAKANTFDIVLASHIIEHVVNPDTLIEESKRLLKKNGVLIVITPNLACWFNRVLLLVGIQPLFTEVSTLDKTLGQKSLKRFAQSKEPVGHLRLFTPLALEELLHLHGFYVVQKSGVEFGAFPPWLRIIDRWIARVPSLAPSMIMVAKKG